MWRRGSTLADSAVLRPAALIAGCSAGMYVANGVNMSFFAVLLESRGLEAAQISFILGVAFLARVVAGPVWGALCDRLRQVRPVLAASMVLAGAGTLGVLGVQGFWPLFTVVMLYSVGASALMPLYDLLTLAAARRLKFDFGRVRAVGSCAFMLGALGAGFVVAAVGPQAVAWLMGGFMGVSLLMLPLMPEARERAHMAHAADIGAVDSGPDPSPLGIPAFRRMLAVSALLQGAHAAYYALSTLHWRAAGLSDQVIGLLWAEAVLAEILIFVFCRKAIARLGPANLMVIGAVGATVRWTGTALSTDPFVLAALQPLHAASFTLPYLAALQVMGHCVPVRRAASAQSLNAAIGMALPTGVLMFVSGLLYARVGGLVFLAMAALTLASLGLIPRLRRSVVWG
jgi:PPP family 3-phenylpropionic acid transporter